MKAEQKWFGSRGLKWGLLPLIIVGCCLSAWFFLFNSGLPQKGPPYSTLTPANMDVSCLGRLQPGGRILRIAAPAGAVIRDLLVQRGRLVEKGEVLARLRDYAREAALLNRAEKDVAVAAGELECVRAGEKVNSIEAQKAAVARQETILRNLETEYQRYQNLRGSGAVPARALDEAHTNRDAARESLLREKHLLGSLKDIRKEDIALAANKLESAEAARKVAMENVELNLIRAPVSGRVLEVHAFPGEAVRDRGLLDMGSGEEVLVEAEVHVNDIGRVRLGAPAVVFGDAIPENLMGEVVEIISMVTRSEVLPTDPLAFSDLRVVKVWIRLENSEPVAHLGHHQVSVVIKP